MFGVVRGVELALEGDLSSTEEVRANPISEIVEDARVRAIRLVTAEAEEDMSHWRQVVIGEIVGVSVAARTFAGRLDELTDEALREAFVIIFGPIDKWVYGG
jgi:hypothetical protein